MEKYIMSFAILDLFIIPVAILYVTVLVSLFIYGLNFYYLAYISWSQRKRRIETPQISKWPRVTVQLPIFNEMYVAERLIKAAAKLDYPADLLEIQVLDDSTDETVAIVRRLVNHLREDGLNIMHLHRTDRKGYKAGALACGTDSASGEFLAIFDADFIPPEDFLRRTIPHFQNERIGFIQTRWGHINREYNFLTFVQSMAIDAHFMVEQYARNWGGYWFNFNGTAGIWRKATIKDAGGWRAETLTEDLDLSYRAFLKGWKALYLRDVVVKAELPVNFTGYRRQQHRWARGSLECALKFIPVVWKSSVPLPQKIEATLHLSGYGVHLLLFSLVFLYPLVLILSQSFPHLTTVYGIAFLFNFTAFAPTLFFILAQQQLGNRWWRFAPIILFLPALGAGMMLNTVRAAGQIIGGKKNVFERTPKFGIVDKRQSWINRRYQLKLDTIVYYELALALLNMITVVLAVYWNNWVIAGYALMFSVGLIFTSGFTIAQSMTVYWHQIRSRRGAKQDIIKI
jgi:cellulose synthase/poly-beta-1,6-N-acetylglucosamine synthase-like glycosyltransferase